MTGQSVDRGPRPQRQRVVRVVALVAGIVTALVTFASWRSQDIGSVYYDEAAYLLQAELFAEGRWSDPSPPVPEFFEQYHVLVEPVLASKYFPGHSIVLVPGVWADFDALMPIVLAGMTAAFLILLVDGRLGTVAAVAVWLFWLIAPLAIGFRPTFLSETTSGFLWVLGLWLLDKWWASGKRWQLAAISAAVSWMAITRPLTAVAFGLPLAAVIGWQIWHHGKLGDLILPGMLAVTIVGVLPLWSQVTTGDWRKTPYSLYTSQYMPWDRMGFGLDSTPPSRAGPPDMERHADIYRALHRGFGPWSMAQDTARRFVRVWTDVWGHGAILAVVLAACVFLSPPAGLALVAAQAALLVILYGFYSHPLDWNVYYFEAVPVLCLLPIAGIVTLSLKAAPANDHSRMRVTAAACFALVALVATSSTLAFAEVTRRGYAQRILAAALAQVDGPAVVLVHRDSTRSVHNPLVVISPSMSTERVWLAHDLGPRNERLLGRVPNREAFLYDEQSGSLTRLPRDSAMGVLQSLRTASPGRSAYLYDDSPGLLTRLKD